MKPSDQPARPAITRVPVWLLYAPFGISFALAAWALPRLGDQLPVHWNAAGQPDRWGSPVEALFMLPGILLFGALVVFAAGRAQPSAQPLLRAVVLGLGLMTLGDVAALAFGWDSFRVTMGSLGLLFMLVGPTLAASEPSALNPPQLSRAALRRAGRAWTALGALVLVASVWAPVAGWVSGTLLLGLVGLLLLVTLSARRDRRQGNV